MVYLCLAYSGMINAQELSNFRKKTLIVQGDRTKIDTISIVPNSLIIDLLDRSYFKVDYASATLFWLKPPPKQTYEVTYRVLPFDFTKGEQRLSFDSIFYRFGISGEKLLGKASENRPFDFGKINSNGSIGRTLSFGNRQDAVFNSSLNLQLNGYMGDSILLSAAISDNNIPIQPDGNSQNLNEFDRIFIQFSKDRWKLALGDLDIRQGGDGFS